MNPIDYVEIMDEHDGDCDGDEEDGHGHDGREEEGPNDGRGDKSIGAALEGNGETEGHEADDPSPCGRPGDVLLLGIPATGEVLSVAGIPLPLPGRGEPKDPGSGAVPVLQMAALSQSCHSMSE